MQIMDCFNKVYENRFLFLFIWFRLVHAEFDCNGKINGYYPNPATCNEYIQCKTNNVINFHCRHGLVWNSIDKYCYIGVCFLVDKGTSNARYDLIKNSKCTQDGFMTLTIPSKLQCAQKCAELYRCEAFQWSKGTQKCVLLDQVCDFYNRIKEYGTTLGRIAPYFN